VFSVIFLRVLAGANNRTGYFWEVENRLKVLLDKVFSKIP
jgi:hypothetical protein